MHAHRLLLPAAAAAALLIAGCGGGGSAPPATGGSSAGGSPAGGSATSTLKLSADPTGAFKFNTTRLKAKAGKVTILMHNPSTITHAIAVSGNGVSKDGQEVQQGGTSKLVLNLKPGTYTFFCPVDGHEQAGMKGTLTIR